MKITKKQPLRPRGRSEDKRQSTKNAIRDAYINGPQKERSEERRVGKECRR